MSIYRPLFSRFDTFLAADVANNGTYTTAYPAGTTQQDFDTGLGSVGGEAVVNDSDKWTVAAAQLSFAFGASLITITNTSGVTWPANSKVSLEIDRQIGNACSIIPVQFNLASIANGALLNPGLRPGIIGTLEYWEAYIQTAATTAAKLTTLNPTINGVDVTGGTIALTSANATPAGITLPCALITGANAVAAASKIGFKAASTTAFVEGVITAYLRIRHAASNAY
jgi:hypothetical protein